LATVVLSSCTTTHPSAVSAEKLEWKRKWDRENPIWRGLHLSVDTDGKAVRLIKQLPSLRKAGVNSIIAEVDYGFQFKAHPELKFGKGLSIEAARRLEESARSNGIWLIPQFNCFGHQSEGKTILPLLMKYPGFDETPGKYPDNKGIYCRSWCPENPGLYPIVFTLLDEIADAFDADTLHVGMDEVFIIGDKDCPRCHGKDPAQLFSKSVNQIYRHLSEKRGLQMMMWGDRLLDAKVLGNSKWESSTNGTSQAIEKISRNIIICDWHYGKQSFYASLPIFTSKGFRTWATGWQPLEESLAFNRYAHTVKSPNLKGFLATTWGKTSIEKAAEWPPLVETLKTWK
jgi:hypothetical protein